MDSPASILIAFLVADGKAVLGGKPGAWPAFTGAMPVGGAYTPAQYSKVDNILTVYDTAPFLDGRLMSNGEVIEHAGVQVRVRGEDYPVGRGKADELKNVLDQIKNQAVALGSKNYTITSVHRISGIIPIGPEGESKRQLFTINALLSIKEN